MDDAASPPQSPQRRERCPQNMFDPILRKFASSFPSTALRYLTRLGSFEQDTHGVTAEIESIETGERSTIRSRYLIGCDGAHSKVRKALGIKMKGNAALTHTTNIIFRCPHLLSLHDKGKAYRHIFLGPEGTWATIVAINGNDQWRMSLVKNLGKENVTDKDIHAAIRRAVGVDFEYEILSVMPWTRQELVAERYGEGRCFIAGDAAHVMSPTGGFGMNTGIGDAVDLSWKMSAVIEGWGDPRLLDSYDVERRPVGLRNVAEASRNLARMLSPGNEPALIDDTEEGRKVRERVGREFSAAMNHEWHTLGTHLGYRYETSPICWPDGSEPLDDDPRSYRPTARPGSRAPHVWLSDGRSTLDLFGRGFVLLRLGKNPPDTEPLTSTAALRGVPLAAVRIDDPLVHETYERSLVLVRPDGHVAWRGDELPPSSTALIDRARGAEASLRGSKDTRAPSHAA